MTTAVRPSTAVGYFRVSSPGQAGERHVSLEAQATQFHAYCLAHNLEPVKTFTDIASGRKDNRQEYRSMLDYVTSQRASGMSLCCSWTGSVGTHRNCFRGYGN